MNAPDHDDTMGGTCDTGWTDSLRHLRQGIAGMDAVSRLWVLSAASIIRWIVLHTPRFSGAIACAMVYIEVETALSGLRPGTREAAARSTC